MLRAEQGRWSAPDGREGSLLGPSADPETRGPLLHPRSRGPSGGPQGQQGGVRPWPTAIGGATPVREVSTMRRAGVVLPGVVGLAAVTLVCAYVWRPWQLHWGATAEEVSRPMPGDDSVPRPRFDAARAVTIEAAPEHVWPWLAQMGAFTRAGWYSYDARRWPRRVRPPGSLDPCGTRWRRHRAGRCCTTPSGCGSGLRSGRSLGPSTGPPGAGSCVGSPTSATSSRLVPSSTL